MEGYANYLELNVWTSSIITKTEWNDELKTWTVEIKRGGKETRALRVKHLVFATGFGGRPYVPDIPGKVNEFLNFVIQTILFMFPSQETFKGEAIHSEEFTSASNYVGKKAVIIGACTAGMSY